MSALYTVCLAQYNLLLAPTPSPVDTQIRMCSAYFVAQRPEAPASANVGIANKYPQKFSPVPCRVWVVGPRDGYPKHVTALVIRFALCMCFLIRMPSIKPVPRRFKATNRIAARLPNTVLRDEVVVERPSSSFQQVPAMNCNSLRSFATHRPVSIQSIRLPRRLTWETLLVKPIPFETEAFLGAKKTIKTLLIIIISARWLLNGRLQSAVRKIWTRPAVLCAHLTVSACCRLPTHTLTSPAASGRAAP